MSDQNERHRPETADGPPSSPKQLLLRPLRVSPDRPDVRSGMSLHALIGRGDANALPAGPRPWWRQVLRQGGGGASAVIQALRACAVRPGPAGMTLVRPLRARLRCMSRRGRVRGSKAHARAAVSPQSTTAPSAVRVLEAIIPRPAQASAGSCGGIRRQHSLPIRSWPDSCSGRASGAQGRHAISCSAADGPGNDRTWPGLIFGMLKPPAAAAMAAGLIINRPSAC